MVQQVVDELPTPLGNGSGEEFMHLASGIAAEASAIIQRAFPDLREMFLVENCFRFQGTVEDGWIAIRVVFDPRLSMAIGPKMEDEDRLYLRQKIAGDNLPGPAILRDELGAEWFSRDRFTYIGRGEGGYMSWPDVQSHLIDWLSSLVVPDVLERNRRRVLRAIPAPPEYDLSHISGSLWVLECESDLVQGTAFALEGIGFVTCAHSLGSASHAFRFDAPEYRYPITERAKNTALDLAVFDINHHTGAQLRRGEPSSLKQMDHLLIAGHPNYRTGDSPLIAPGIVVGFRPKSGVRRILTNAPIVAGASGGPVFNADGSVIGVAVTGADRLDEVNDTEDLGIIPIDALDILLG